MSDSIRAHLPVAITQIKGQWMYAAGKPPWPHVPRPVKKAKEPPKPPLPNVPLKFGQKGFVCYKSWDDHTLCNKSNPAGERFNCTLLKDHEGPHMVHFAPYENGHYVIKQIWENTTT